MNIQKKLIYFVLIIILVQNRSVMSINPVWKAHDTINNYINISDPRNGKSTFENVIIPYFTHVAEGDCNPPYKDIKQYSIIPYLLLIQQNNIEAAERYVKGRGRYAIDNEWSLSQIVCIIYNMGLYSIVDRVNSYMIGKLFCGRPFLHQCMMVHMIKDPNHTYNHCKLGGCSLLNHFPYFKANPQYLQIIITKHMHDNYLLMQMSLLLKTAVNDMSSDMKRVIGEYQKAYLLMHQPPNNGNVNAEEKYAISGDDMHDRRVDNEHKHNMRDGPADNIEQGHNMRGGRADNAQPYADYVPPEWPYIMGVINGNVPSGTGPASVNTGLNAPAPSWGTASSPNAPAPSWGTASLLNAPAPSWGYFMRI
jgi:hypothetical protein